MKKRNKISLIAQLLSGVLLVAVILAQSVQTAPTETDKQEQSNEQSEKEDLVIQPKVAIPHSTSQINLEFDSYLLDERVYQEEDDQENSISDLVFQNIEKTTKILFRKIISPNAP